MHCFSIFDLNVVRLTERKKTLLYRQQSRHMMRSVTPVALYSLCISFGVVFIYLMWTWVYQNHAVHQFLRFPLNLSIKKTKQKELRDEMPLGKLVPIGDVKMYREGPVAARTQDVKPHMSYFDDAPNKTTAMSF